MNILSSLYESIYNLSSHRLIALLTSRFIFGRRDMHPENCDLEFKKTGEICLSLEPKQVQLSGNEAYVTSMKQAKLDIFNITENSHIAEVKLAGMPVEILIAQHLNTAFISEMGKGPDAQNSVFGVNLATRNLDFRVATKGLWSKFMAINPTSGELWVSNWKSNDISIINIATQRVLDVIPAGNTPRGIAFTPDGKSAYVCGYYSRDIIKYDASGMVPQTRILMPFKLGAYQGSPRHIVIDNQGKYGYFSNMGRGTLHKIDLSTDKIVDTIYSGKRAATIVMTPDQRYLACAHDGENLISISSLSPFQIVATIPTQGEGFGLDISQDGKYLVFTSFRSRMLEIFKINQKN